MSFWLSLALYGLYALVLVYLSWTDLRTRRIPNVVIGPAILLALAVMTWTVGIGPALLGAVVGPLPLIVGRLFAGARQVGMGDIKLAIFVGLILGFPAALWAVMLGLILSLVVGFVGIVRGGYTLHSRLPFGPFLAVAVLPLLVIAAVVRLAIL